jgi:hypothetical protein
VDQGRERLDQGVPILDLPTDDGLRLEFLYACGLQNGTRPTVLHLDQLRRVVPDVQTDGGGLTPQAADEIGESAQKVSFLRVMLNLSLGTHSQGVKSKPT